MRIKNYKDLVVWQKSHNLAKKILAMVKSYPKVEEAEIIKQQLIRSAISIPANIAEGYGGNKGQAFKNYLTIARRSTNETDYWLLLSTEVGYVNEKMFDDLSKDCREIILMLTSMINKLEMD